MVLYISEHKRTTAWSQVERELIGTVAKLAAIRGYQVEEVHHETDDGTVVCSFVTADGEACWALSKSAAREYVALHSAGAVVGRGNAFFPVVAALLYSGTKDPEGTLRRVLTGRSLFSAVGGESVEVLTVDA